MTDAQYLQAAEQLLAHIERCCDQINETTDADIDNQRVGNMLTLTFANKTQIIINLQKPLHEIWMATKAGGYHYQLNAHHSQWQCTRQNTELIADLSLHASAQTALNLKF